MSKIPHTVLITGAASGIGQALAQRVAKDAKRLILWGRHIEGLRATAATCGNVECILQEVDVADEASVAKAFGELTAQNQLPQFLFHAAGILHVGDLDRLKIQDCRSDVLVNYMGTVHMLVHAARNLAPESRIICVSSVSGFKGFQEFPGYCASKFAVLGFCEGIYYDLKKKGIHLSVICPPAIDTPMVRNLDHRPILYDVFPFASKDSVIESIVKAIPKTNRFLILVDLQTRFLHTLNGLLPETTSAVFDMIIRRKRKAALPPQRMIG